MEVPLLWLVKKGSCMKKQRSFWLAVISLFTVRQNLQAVQLPNVSSTIDPIADLRPPYSLTELLHEGLNTVSDLLLDQIDQGVASELSLDHMSSELDKLSTSLDTISFTTRSNQVMNADKEFLQSMIDRIDNLIVALENKDSAYGNKMRSIKSISAALKNKLRML